MKRSRIRFEEPLSIFIRPARPSDAPAMGKVFVETYLRAHKGQIPEGAWQRRRDEFTWEASAEAWGRSMRDIADGSSPQDCIYLAVDGEAGEAQGQVVGVVQGGPAEALPGAGIGEVYALYVRYGYHRRGLGRKLVQAAVRHLRGSGMNRLVICTLVANEPGNRFYKALGGQIICQRQSEFYGFPIQEHIFGWEDSARLLADDQDKSG